MARAKHPVPYALNKLHFNAKSGTYDVSESGVIYSMPLELTRSLKAYFSNYTSQTVAEWYKKLPSEDRLKIYRVGGLPQSNVDHGFYPDSERIEI
jgi:hypothetical protein